MSTSPEKLVESPTAERRNQSRREPIAKTVVVNFNTEYSAPGRVVDESLGGIGIEFEAGLEFEPTLNQEVTVSYSGVELSATIRHLLRASAGPCRIGFEWNAVGYSQMERGIGDGELSEFFQSLPCGLFVMTEFAQNEKWAELGETAERMRTLATRCGISEVEASVDRLLEAIENEESSDSPREHFHSLIKQCLQLKGNYPNALAIEPDDAPGGEVALVESLLGSIQKTNNELTIKALADVLRGMMASVAPEIVAEVFDLVGVARAATTNPLVVPPLASVLNAAAARLPAEPAEQAFHQLVSMLDQSSDVESTRGLGAVLDTLAEKLPAATTEQIFHELVEKIQNGSDHQVESLASLTQIMAEKLPGDAVTSAVTFLIGTIEMTTEASSLRSLKQLLQLLTDRLPMDEIPGVFQRLVLAVERTSDESALQCLAQVLNAVTERMPFGERMFS